MSHQNMAAKYRHENWTPQPMDLLGDPDCHLYDANHLLGQLLVNNGNVSDGLLMFGRAMTIQNKLSGRYVIPKELFDKLSAFSGFDVSKPIRIVPYEWVTQIGHLGMLDALIKMSKLGMRPAVNWVLLAPQSKVINQAYLRCWQKYFIVVSDHTLVNELFPYQRICGEQFNCFIETDGTVLDWSDAASRAFREWDAKGLGPLLKVPESSIIKIEKKPLISRGTSSSAEIKSASQDGRSRVRGGLSSPFRSITSQRLPPSRTSPKLISTFNRRQS
jgi:hypothetical protein